MKLMPYTDNLQPGLNKDFINVVIYYIFLFLVAGTGIYVRLLGYASTPLWSDEAARAILMCNPMALFKETGPINGACSVGYILLNTAIAAIYNTDFTLRLTTLIPSIISIILIYRIAVQLTDKKIIHLLAVFLVSLNPFLVSYAKYLKPYSFELMLHLINISLLLVYLKDKSFRNLVILIGCAYFTLYFATNIIFLYPAIFLITGLDSVQNKNRKQLIFIGVSSFVCLISIGFLYIVLFYKAPSIESGVLSDATKSLFYLKGDATKPFSFIGFFQWVGQQSVEMIVNFNSLRVNFFYSEIFERSNKIIMPALYILGIVITLIKKEYKYLILFLLPVLTAALFASPLLPKWPFGWARMNIFMCGYFLFIVMLGLNYLLDIRIIKYFTYLYIIILFMIHLPLNMDVYSCVTNEDIISPLVYLNDNRTVDNTNKELLCVNYGGHMAFQYYAMYNTVTSKKFKNTIESLDILFVPNAYNKYNEMDAKMRELLRQRKNIWYLYSHLSISEADLAEEILLKYSSIIKKQQYSGAGIYYCESKIFPGPGQSDVLNGNTNK